MTNVSKLLTTKGKAIIDKIKGVSGFKGGIIQKYAALETMWQLYGEPDVLLGKLIPLYNVDYYDVSTSQDVVKFRAIGAQFLAHQLGHNEAFRIDCEVPKNTSAFYLSAIEALFRYGQEFENLTPGASSIIKKIASNQQPISKKNLNLRDGKYVERVSSTDYSWIQSKGHKTFDVLTQETPLFSCYLETYSIQNNVDMGKNTYRIVLLLRKFIPPDVVTDVSAIKSEWYGKAVGVKDVDSRFNHPFLNDTQLANKTAHYVKQNSIGKYLIRKPQYTKRDRQIELFFQFTRSVIEMNKRFNKIRASSTIRDVKTLIERIGKSFEGIASGSSKYAKEMMFNWDSIQLT